MTKTLDELLYETEVEKEVLHAVSKMSASQACAFLLRVALKIRRECDARLDGKGMLPHANEEEAEDDQQTHFDALRAAKRLHPDERQHLMENGAEHPPLQPSQGVVLAPDELLTTRQRIRILIETTPEGAARLQAARAEGKLETLAGLPVVAVERAPEAEEKEDEPPVEGAAPPTFQGGEHGSSELPGIGEDADHRGSAEEERPNAAVGVLPGSERDVPGEVQQPEQGQDGVPAVEPAHQGQGVRRGGGVSSLPAGAQASTPPVPTAGGVFEVNDYTVRRVPTPGTPSRWLAFHKSTPRITFPLVGTIEEIVAELTARSKA